MFNLSARSLNKIYEESNWEERARQFDSELASYLNSERSMQLLHKAITEKIENTDSLEKMTLENMAKLATTLVKLIPDLAAVLSSKAEPNTSTEKKIIPDKRIEIVRQDKQCMDYVYKIIDRLDEIENNQIKSQK